MATVTEICNLARAIIGDSAGETYRDDVLLPFVQAAYLDLELEFVERAISFNETSSDLNLTAGQTSITTSSSPALPSDLIAPLSLEEKKTGSTDKFTPVNKPEYGDLPDLDQVDQLRYWIWEAGQIKLLGATVPVTVRLRYTKQLPELVNSGSTILIPHAKNYLAWHAASLVASARGETDLFDRAEVRVNAYLDQILRSYISADQRGGGVRRRPYGWLR